jgi:hypothetical protein
MTWMLPTSSLIVYLLGWEILYRNFLQRVSLTLAMLRFSLIFGTRIANATIDYFVFGEKSMES